MNPALERKKRPSLFLNNKKRGEKKVEKKMF
jgi:hypothetical protein